MPGIYKYIIKAKITAIKNIAIPFFLYPLIAWPSPGIMNEKNALIKASVSMPYTQNNLTICNIFSILIKICRNIF